jgi:putative endonuclease
MMHKTTDPRTAAQRTGDDGEARAVAHLRTLGYEIQGTKVRVGRDEVDVVARDGGVVVFVEVRVRSHLRDALESVNAKKQARLLRAAARYLGRDANRVFSRFDVIAIADDATDGVTHIVDAFRGR